MNYLSGFMLGSALVSQLFGASSGGMGGSMSGMGGMGRMGGAAGAAGAVGGIANLLQNMGGGRGAGRRGDGNQGFSLSGVLPSGIGQPSVQAPPVQNQRRFPALQARPLELVSSLPGRRRYRARCLSEELAAVLEEKLARLSYIRSVRINPASGSLLFLFDEADAAKVDALAEWLEKHIFSMPQCSAGSNADAGSALTDANAGQITRSIHHMAQSFSAWIKEHTYGYFDISSLASTLFLLRGIRKMVITQQYPTGVQMLWWALALMRGWRV